MSQSPHPPTNSSPHTRRPRVYGMVTTAASGEYTAAALDSFIESTELTQQDLFVLIVNDHHKVDVPQALQQSCRVILHEHPRSFAENANICTAIARERSSDLYFLNNDLIFTPGWAEHLAVPMPVITLPVSNQEFPYEAEDFKLLPLMTLEDYAGKEVLFRRFVAAHQAQKKGYQIVLSPPFFCIRIPLEILIEVGDFDPTFGKGGAEDNDYAIRTYLKGFAILASRQAYLIHFGGKSTWAGAESAAETRARDEAYIFRFREKWGTKLATLVLRSQLIKREPQLLNSLPKGLQSATQEGNWRPVILALAREEKIDCSPFTSPPPSVGAVYVIYDPEPWLHASYLAIYKHVQSVFFLVADKPWNGEIRDNTALLEEISRLPDPENKKKLIRGTWQSETEQRNAGIDLLSKDKTEYCMVVDADEVYHPHHLRDMLKCIAEKRYIPAWRVHWHTYWKSPEYRIDPPEPFKPLVFLRTDALGFKDKREPINQHSQVIPEEIGICHHFSYARSDEEVLRKLETFSHSHEIVPNWYNSVWKAWDKNRELQNLHPCWPEAYKCAIRVNDQDLPDTVRSKEI